MPDSAERPLGAQKAKEGAGASAVSVLTAYALARWAGIVEPPSDELLVEAIIVVAGAIATAGVTAWRVYVKPNLPK